MEETQLPDKEQATIPSKSWPWIVTGMGVIILALWNQHKEDQTRLSVSESSKTNIILEASRRGEKNEENAMELARLSKHMLEQSDYHELLKDSLNYYRSRYRAAHPK